MNPRAPHIPTTATTNSQHMWSTSSPVNSLATRAPNHTATHVIVPSCEVAHSTYLRHRNMQSPPKTQNRPTTPTTTSPATTSVNDMTQTFANIAIILMLMLLLIAGCAMGVRRGSMFCATGRAYYFQDDTVRDDGAADSATSIRKNMILKKLEKHKRIVQQEDLVTNGGELKSSFTVEVLEEGVEEAKPTFLALPEVDVDSRKPPTNVFDASTHSAMQPQCHRPRRIPNRCAICLEGYAPGETVVWSVNPWCPHAFHEDCILHWLVVKQRPSCPCCRRDFLNPAASERPSRKEPNGRDHESNSTIDDAARGGHVSRSDRPVIVNVQPVEQACTTAQRSGRPPTLLVSVSLREEGLSCHSGSSNISAHFLYDSFPVQPRRLARHKSANIPLQYGPQVASRRLSI